MKKKEWSEELRDEWNKRALRSGEMAVMSTRFPADECDAESKRYVSAVMKFVNEELKGKDVLEIGCGIGRITEQLVGQAKKLTCIEPSSEMIKRNKERLGSNSRKITYLEIFADEYNSASFHDAVICSLVLNHNSDSLLERITKVISDCADTIFLFEHTGFSSEVSQYTFVRNEAELLSFFKNYQVSRRSKYQHFFDEISLMNLVR